MLEGLFAPWHVLVIGTIALLVLGPKELPAAARRAGALLSDLRRWRADLEGEVRGAFSDPQGAGDSD